MFMKVESLLLVISVQKVFDSLVHYENISWFTQEKGSSNAIFVTRHSKLVHI